MFILLAWAYKCLVNCFSECDIFAVNDHSLVILVIRFRDTILAENINIKRDHNRTMSMNQYVLFKKLISVKLYLIRISKTIVTNNINAVHILNN